MAKWTSIGDLPLRSFDTEARGLLTWADELGWVGRLSSKGHAILRAPDGHTTAAVARNCRHGNRSFRNARADIQRWARVH